VLLGDEQRCVFLQSKMSSSGCVCETEIFLWDRGLLCWPGHSFINSAAEGSQFTWNSLSHEHKECSPRTIGGEHIGKKFIKRKDWWDREVSWVGCQWSDLVQDFYPFTLECCSISMLIRCTESGILIGCAHNVLLFWLVLPFKPRGFEIPTSSCSVLILIHLLFLLSIL
jgi:hypothetical protein